MQQLNVCVIGAGALGTRHAECWQKVPDVEVVAVCDANEERAVAAGEKFGVSGVYFDHEAAFAHPGIDVVSVAVPQCAHRTVSEAAMRRGYHVICEKPLATTLADGEAMLTAAEECGVKFALGFCKRFSPQVRKTRELVQTGAIGRPVMYRHTSGIEVRPKGWIMDKEQSGGPIVDIGCHYFDQWRLIFDSEPVRVMAMGLTLSTESPLMANYDPEIDTTTVLVEFESGDLGMLSLSWGLPEKVSTGRLEDLLGPKGIINVEGADKLTVVTEGGEQVSYDNLGADMVAEEIASFARSIREDKPVFAGGKEGLIALRVSLAALRSIATGKAITL